MINITSSERVQALYIPLNKEMPAGLVALRLIVRSTHDEGPEISINPHGWEVIGTFVRVVVELPDSLHQGEWDYSLRTRGQNIELSSGLMQVGPMPADAEAVEYNQTIEYKEYGN